MPWYDKQKAILGSYRRMARMPDPEYRALLHEVTGCTSSTDPALTQGSFDWFMARMEAEFWRRIQEGQCPDPAAKVDINYWRNRLAKNGEANKRMTHLVYTLWDELKTMLPPESRTTDYLRGLAAQANRRRITAISELKGWQICIVIEALKARIFQTRKSLAADRAGLPGAAPTPEPVAAASTPALPVPRSDADTEDAPLNPTTVYAGFADSEVPF